MDGCDAVEYPQLMPNSTSNPSTIADILLNPSSPSPHRNTPRLTPFHNPCPLLVFTFTSPTPDNNDSLARSLNFLGSPQSSRTNYKMVAPARYVDLKVPALRELCAERGLDSTGLRRDLIARLERKDRLVEERGREVRIRGRGAGEGDHGGTAFFRDAEEGQMGLERSGTVMEKRGQELERRQQDNDRARNAGFSPRNDQEGGDSRSFHSRSTQLTPQVPRSDARSNSISSVQGVPFRQNTENSHPHDDPSIMYLSEPELVDILFANYTPFEPDRSGHERRRKIRDEHDAKVDEAKKKRDTAISKANTKYDNEVGKLKVEKVGKLQELER